MKTAHRKWLNVVAVLCVSIAASAAISGASWAQNSRGNISNNDGIFIDGKTFEIVGGKTKGDVAAQIKNLGARELGGGAIIFRSGDKLYFVAGALLPPGPQSSLDEDVGPIRIEYVPPKNPAHQHIYEQVKEHRALETLRQIYSPFRMQENLYVKTLGCDGVPNAYFFRENGRATIRLCYEYLEEVENNLPQETTPSGITPHEALVGQVLFAFSHEMGHAVYDIYDIAVFGRQEDAADEFATYMLLQFGGERAHRLIKGAAWSYKGFMKNFKDQANVTMPLAAFSSDHGLPQQRFYNLACISYGYDPKIFEEVLHDDVLPEHRARVCKYEYANLRYAVNKMITPHIDHAQEQKVLNTNWLQTIWKTSPVQ
jgi:hypothetical protein